MSPISKETSPGSNERLSKEMKHPGKVAEVLIRNN